MGTDYFVKYGRAQIDATPDAIAQGALAAMENVNAKMSTWRKDSEISRFNQSRSTACARGERALVGASECKGSSDSDSGSDSGSSSSLTEIEMGQGVPSVSSSWVLITGEGPYSTPPSPRKCHPPHPVPL